jgi:hypothetical protein
MARLAVVSNPKSQRNRRGALAEVRGLLAGRPDVRHEEIRDFAELDSLLDDLLRDGVETVAVNGGDGAVQAVLTSLGRRAPDGDGPKLAVLEGGMTNVIAKDVGVVGAPAKALARLIKALETDQSIEATRPLIGLSLSPRERPIYGMFFGAAGFYQAVKLANERVRKSGVAGNLASASTVALSLARLLLGRPGRDDPFYRGEPMAIALDGAEQPEAPYLILIATTLDRLILGLKPFWNGGDRGIRYTSVAFPPKRLGCALLPALRGRPKRWMIEDGYQSGAAKDIAIAIKSPVVLDGEIYHPDPSIPIRLAGDRSQTFIRC